MLELSHITKPSSGTRYEVLSQSQNLVDRIGDLSDELIWKKFLDKDKDAFNFIYGKYVDCLFNFGRQYTRDRQVILDTIHDMFIRLRSQERNTGIISIKSYLYKCFYRDLIRNLKKFEKKVDKLDYLKYEVTISLNQLNMDQQVSLGNPEMLQDAINKLPVKQRQAILLFYYENMSYRELAEVFGMRRVTSARKLLYRAIDHMRGILNT